MDDNKESHYFEDIRKRKASEIENQAKVFVAEATKMGDIGKKEREATTRQQVAQFEAETVLKENERNQEIEKSKAQLEVVKAEAFKTRTLAQFEAKKATEIRETNLQREVEERRLSMETEKLRAITNSKAKVTAEAKIIDYNANAEAKVIEYNALVTSLKIEADAKLYQKEKEAEGIQRVYEAQSNGIKDLIGTFGGNSDALLQYLLLDKGVYEKLAKSNADAIQGLQPKITIWQTGDGAGNQESYTKPIADILKMIPPLITTINDQTGLKPGKWLVDMEKSGDH